MICRLLISLGKASFYIMAIHLAAFKLADCIIAPNDLNSLTAKADNIIEVLIFVIFGVLIPFLIWLIVNFIKNNILIKNIKS